VAMAVRWREAEGGTGAGAGNAPGATESSYAQLERVLREAYEAARSGRQEQQEHEIELPELGGLLVKVYMKQYEEEEYTEVYMKQYEEEEYTAVLEVLKSGHPLCKVELSIRNGEPLAVSVDCWELENLASECARGGSCWLSWEEMEDALKLTGWAANVLAELAGIPVKVEGTGLVDALPCLQVSVNGKSYSVCQWAYLSHDPNRGWEVKGDYRLIPIGEAHIKIAEALMELEEMVEKYVENREREGAEYIYAAGHTRAREYRGEFLRLKEVVLRRPDGTEEVLLEPQLSWIDYIGEDFTVVYCPYSCPEGSDSELADALRKELEEVVGVVVQECRRYTEELDPRYAAFAYIVVEALRRAGLAPA